MTSRGVGLTIAILSWGAPLTLIKTLRSYRRHGLLDCADEVLVHWNEVGVVDRAIASAFGIPCTGSRENIGIGRAIAALAARARGEYFLLLENDWELVEPHTVTRRRLARAMDIIRSDHAQVVRLRHRVRHGEPLFTRPLAGRELEAPECLLESAYWMRDPAARFPDHISKQVHQGEDWFFAAARHAGYTNNPCLYRTSFVREAIVPFCDAPGTTLEKAIETAWRAHTDVYVCQGPGLFMHSRIDRHHLGARWLRTFAGVLLKRAGIRRPGRAAVSREVGGPWRSDL